MRWRFFSLAGAGALVVALPFLAVKHVSGAEPAPRSAPAAVATEPVVAPVTSTKVSEAPAPSAVAPAPRVGGRLELTALEREPKEGMKKPSETELAALRKAAADSPRDRGKRFELVRALMLGGDPQAALTEAKAWREKDAYNLVVVRLLGDLYAELGDRARARRAYSSVVELLPGDAEAQRALATVLKQSGDLEGAYDRLRAATGQKEGDVRVGFELADVAQRLGRTAEAAERFRAIIADARTSEAVRYPAKQRLTQIDAGLRREALGRRDAAAAQRLGEEIKRLDVHGGVENDIKIYLTWDTDRTDVDLWVRTPAGERVDYTHKVGSGGEALFGDVTGGYGPESFTAKRARPGKYTVEVNYFGTQRQSFAEARGEVVVILGEGTDAEEKLVLPYRIFKPKQTVTVASIDVKG